jgi:hypothetical protein
MNCTSPRRFLVFRLPWAALLAAGCFCLAGCGHAPEFAEVEGTITLDGKPLDNVEVVFLPDPEKGSRGPAASAYTDGRGHYRLRCDQAGKSGAVLGTYRVCVNDITAVAPPPDLLVAYARAEGKQAPPPVPPKGKPPRVPAAYADANRTPLRDVEVKAGRQTLDFDVKGGRK